MLNVKFLLRGLMTTFALVSVVGLSSAVRAEAPDKSGTFLCECATVHCDVSDHIKLTYDHDRQWIEAEGPSWIYSGYVTRQESKTTGGVFLIIPGGYSVMTRDQVISVRPDGEVKLNGSELACTRR